MEVSFLNFYLKSTARHFDLSLFSRWIQVSILVHVSMLRCVNWRPFIFFNSREQQDNIPCAHGGEHSPVCQKNSATLSPRKSGHTNSPGCSTLDYYLLAVVEWETNKTACITQENRKARIIAAFTRITKESLELQQIAKSTRGRGWSLLQCHLKKFTHYLKDSV